MFTAKQVAKASRVFGWKPTKVTEANELVDGLVQFDGFHFSVGCDYVIPVIERGDGCFEFMEEVPCGIVTLETFEQIAEAVQEN